VGIIGKTLDSTFILLHIQFGIMNVCIHPSRYEFVRMNLGVCICAYAFVV